MYILAQVPLFKGECRICKKLVDKGTVHIHHVRPYLSLSETNKTRNLATVCIECHKRIHNNKNYDGVLKMSVIKKTKRIPRKAKRKRLNLIDGTPCERKLSRTVWRRGKKGLTALLSKRPLLPIPMSGVSRSLLLNCTSVTHA